MNDALNGSRAHSAQPDLYPPIEPYESGFLPVSGGHRLAYELCGDRSLPIVEALINRLP